jgi:hypothetical protein
MIVIVVVRGWLVAARHSGDEGRGADRGAFDELAPVDRI